MSVSARRQERDKKPVKRSRSHRVTDVEAYDRALEAHRLHLAGQSWPDIAKATGYISVQVAQMAVVAYLLKAAVGQAPQLRRAALRTELDRLDMLHAAFWPLALQGDPQAANVILKTSDRRARLLGLSQVEDAFGMVPRTIVITDEGMADQVREIALEQEARTAR